MKFGIIGVGALAFLSSQGVVAESLSGESPETWMRQGREAILEAAKTKPINKKAKNIILFVGDGMGISTVTAARILEGQLNGKFGEENFLSFEKLPYTALAKTYNTNQQTPDSAGTMTAMMTGAKSKAGFISVNQLAVRGDADSSLGNELFTLLEKAELAGKVTGIVSTARITHATPASCYAHVPERGWENDSKLPEGSSVKDIAAQLIDFPADWAVRGFEGIDGPEVVLGGGRNNFFPTGPISEEFSSEGGNGLRGDGRNLAQEWLDTRQRAAYVHDQAGFDAVEAGEVDHLFGLFNGDHMEYEVDRAADAGGEPSLSEMASKAIDILKRNRSGFFLMVESGRIDHAHHASNAYRALRETIEFSNAIRMVLDKVDLKNTLVIVTADHSHVFTMAGYPTRGNDIVGLVVGNNREGEPNDGFAKDLFGKPYTTLGYTNGPGFLGASDKQPEGPKSYPHSPRTIEANGAGRVDLAEHYHLVPHEGDRGALHQHLQESCVPMSSETHGGEDVGFWAAGPYAHLLRGTIEQNVIFHLMDYAFDLDVKNPFAAEN